MCLSTLQIKQHLKYFQSKQKKGHVNIPISLKSNEHCSNNAIKNISTDHVNNISKFFYHLV